MGNPPHRAWVDQFGGFIQDDWRVTDRFVLNLGLRYDYYPGFGYKSINSDDPAEVNNLNNPTDIRKMDFGAPRDLHDVIDADKLNFGPRAGFAWTVDRDGRGPSFAVVSGSSPPVTSWRCSRTRWRAPSPQSATAGTARRWRHAASAGLTIRRTLTRS